VLALHLVVDCDFFGKGCIQVFTIGPPAFMSLLIRNNFVFTPNIHTLQSPSIEAYRFDLMLGALLLTPVQIPFLRLYGRPS